MFESNKEYTINEVADKLNISRWVVSAARRNGRVQGHLGTGLKHSNTWLILGKDAQRWAESRDYIKKSDQELARLHNRWLTTPLRATR